MQTALRAQLSGRPTPPLVMALGLGNGDLLRVLQQDAPATRVLAIEPDTAAAAALQHDTLARDWRATGRLTLLVAPAYEGADEAWRLFPPDPDDHVLVVHPDVERGDAAAAVEAARTLKRIVFGARANAEARRAFAPRYLTNTLCNVPGMLAGHDVRGLTDAYVGVPAVVVAAGPSLDAAYPHLAHLQHRALVISVDTALRPLLAAGIEPHLAVGLDPSPLNARHYRDLPDCHHTWLVAESALDPTAANRFASRTCWFRVADHHPWPWLMSHGLDVGRLDVWGSVLTAAYQVAVLAGCNPIVFAGADLAFTGGQPYARGTTYEHDWAGATGRGHTLDEVWRQWHDVRQARWVHDLSGTPTATTDALEAFRDWIVAQSVRDGRRVVNASGSGLLYGRSIEQATLDDIVRAAPSAVLAFPPFPTRADTNRLDLVQLAAGRLLASLETDPSREPLPTWAAFAGGGLDIPAVVDGLRTIAMPRFERRPSATRRAPESMRAVRLPEALARWQAFLADTPVPTREAAAVGEVDPVDALIDALALVTTLAPGLAATDLDSWPVGLGLVAHVPVTAQIDGDASLAWDIASFEALLGLAVPDRRRAQAFGFHAQSAPRVEAIASPPSGDDLLLRLVCQWLLCAAAQHMGLDGARVSALSAISRALSPGVNASLDVGEYLEAAVDAGGTTARVRLPFVLPDGALTHAATGALSVVAPDTAVADEADNEGVPSHLPLVTVASRGRSASLTLRTLRCDWPLADAPGSKPAAAPLTPRVLTDQGLARGRVAYTTGDGSVVVVPWHATASVRLLHGGRVAPHLRWPRPIVGELPFGPEGAVAWTSGTDPGDGGRQATVMYRHTPRGPVTIAKLPFEPSVGAWWHDELYWTCRPGGVARWSPEHGPAVVVADICGASLRVEDAGLLVGLATRGDHGGIIRSTPAGARRLDRHGRCCRVDVGRDGPPSGASTAQQGWMATAWPEADCIGLTHADLHVRLQCFHPLQLAWLGDTLCVSTLTGDVLLFEGLISCLTALREQR